ncbi:1-deoxy-D-xylulose-5-phosphate reductoisomerase [Bacillus thermotolerans]|uniref:1-deoxy-D-xylulose 5-phosphate reductoisomerase n=1 Tax=Bacillus thermotolerans TaxID=1221996 RepID=A0A0F5HZW6_BACTR|nr:1-deoxy-D-xylulose-5-phosphate reductoisomerase [Bacillus thermotolerans]KKB38944.1 1-deoxy-D-xylulose 5-phosphate reductoisomerase [Bacillus thermotolerans]KKB42390.1 1-deoxy-D-xylulose 5-phosphate reductoisomerase [Bacillus thermotolerans]KKB44699.1 1-deoxy-D-xylulose 5-phosphate reductoisomerase [Bacillus thermotolerans]
MKSISLLGATGSIGRQTIDVIRQHPEEFSLAAFSAGRNIDETRKLIQSFQPRLVSVALKEDADRLKTEFPSVQILHGEEGLVEVAIFRSADILVNAVLGSVGLYPTLQAIAAGKKVAIANKETLVTAGHLVMAAAKKNNVDLLPVDSEHSAIFQCLQGEKEKNIERLILTASGGSFRDRTREELKNVTVEEALNHPNWSMGAKITIDSATMMNKGLEVIEAHWLFDLPYEQIDVILHRESIIHSMVEFHDSSVIAQLGTPDMRIPIQYALTYPDRLPLPDAKRLSLAEAGKLHFQPVDKRRFRMLALAYEAGQAGGTMPTVLNAANEAAVAAFLDGKMTFLQIDEMVERALSEHKPLANPDLETIQYADKEARNFVHSLL